MAKASGAVITVSHAYAAALHDRRFRQMESELPDAYLKEEKLIERRDIHDDLITRRLQIISDSYLDVVVARCGAADNVPVVRFLSVRFQPWRPESYRPIEIQCTRSQSGLVAESRYLGVF